MIRVVEGMLRAHDLSQLAERSNSQVQQISAASRDIFSILTTPTTYTLHRISQPHVDPTFPQAGDIVGDVVRRIKVEKKKL